MKQLKKLSALAVGSMTVGLLLGASIAQAEEVCYDGDIVTGIKGLEMLTDQFGQIEVDVDFKYTTGFDVYGPNLDGFPFDDPAFNEEDSFLAMSAINQTLTAENPVPDFVGLSGQNTFYIGVEEETGLNQGLLAVWGGANYTGEQWAPCEREGADDCVLGAGLLNASNQFTYADLTLAEEGASCAGGPPPSGFNITPGTTGSWYDRARSGEGYNFEVLGTPGDYRFYAYFYTYDDTGNQMWISGTGAIDGDTAIVLMVVTSGTVFGEDFNPDDVIREEWGTMTFSFSSCTVGSVDYVSTMGNFGSGTHDLSRLTYVAGLACP